MKQYTTLSKTCKALSLRNMELFSTPVFLDMAYRQGVGMGHGQKATDQRGHWVSGRHLMPGFPSKPPQTEIRREAVARLRVRGLSVRGIAEALTRLPEPIINDKGESYGKSIIGRDLQIIEKRWIEAATEQIDKYKARQLAILEEVQRQGWTKKNLKQVLAAHDRIAKLIGLNAPIHQEHSGPGGGPISTQISAERGDVALRILQEAKFVPPEIQPTDKPEALPE